MPEHTGDSTGDAATAQLTPSRLLDLVLFFSERLKPIIGIVATLVLSFISLLYFFPEFRLKAYKILPGTPTFYVIGIISERGLDKIIHSQINESRFYNTSNISKIIYYMKNQVIYNDSTANPMVGRSLPTSIPMEGNYIYRLTPKDSCLYIEDVYLSPYNRFPRGDDRPLFPPKTIIARPISKISRNFTEFNFYFESLKKSLYFPEDCNASADSKDVKVEKLCPRISIWVKAVPVSCE